MAKETVQAVRQAELEAAGKEQEALKRKDTIILEAERGAKELIATMTKKALEKAELRKATATQVGIELLEAERQKTDSEVLLMKETALRKEAQAIQLILASVIHAS